MHEEDDVDDDGWSGHGFKPGEKVFAVTGDGRFYLGEGTYEGDFDTPWGSGFGKNPRIKLADGQVVWGAECWWGPIEAVEDQPKRPLVRLKRNAKGSIEKYVGADGKDISLE